MQFNNTVSQQSIGSQNKSTLPRPSGNSSMYSVQPQNILSLTSGSLPNGLISRGNTNVQNTNARVAPVVNRNIPAPRPLGSSNMGNMQQQTPPLIPTQPSPNYGPSYYADQLNKTTQDINNLTNEKAPSIAAPLDKFGIGGIGRRLSDAQLADYTARLAPLEQTQSLNAGLVTGTRPQTLSPTDMSYSQFSSPSDINSSNQSSTHGRVFNAGQIAGTQSLGSQDVGYSQQTHQLDNAQGILNGLFQGYTDFGLVPVNEWKNRIATLTSNGQLAGIQVALANAAQSLPDGSAAKAKLLAMGDLANSSPHAIKQALETAKLAIQGQQAAGRTTAGQAHSTGSFSGMANGGAF